MIRSVVGGLTKKAAKAVSGDSANSLSRYWTKLNGSFVSPSAIGSLLTTNGSDDCCIFEVEDLFRDINAADTITLEWDGRHNVTTGLQFYCIGGSGGGGGDGINIGKNPTTNTIFLVIKSEGTAQTVTFTTTCDLKTYYNLKFVIDKVGLTCKLYNNDIELESQEIDAIGEINLYDSKIYIGSVDGIVSFYAFQTGRIKVFTDKTTILTADSSQKNEAYWFASDGKNNHGKWQGTGTKNAYYKDAPTGILNGFTKWVNSAGSVINVPHANGVKQNVSAFLNGTYQEALDYPATSAYNNAPILLDFAPITTLVPLLTNRIINGDFNSATGWTISGGTISGGVATFTASGAGVYRSDIPFVQNHRYIFKLKFNSFTAGSCGIRLGGSFLAETIDMSNTFNAAGTYYYYYTHTAADANLKTEIRVRATFTCELDEFLCYDLNETNALSLFDRANITIHEAGSIAARPDAFFTYRWYLPELDYRVYKDYFTVGYINRFFVKSRLRAISSEYDLYSQTEIWTFPTALEASDVIKMINYIGFTGKTTSSSVTIANLWNASFVYDDIILGVATGAYTKNTFSYSSSIDDIDNLYGRYNYDDGFSQQPILLLCHGWSKDADIFSDAEMQNYSSKGFFTVALGLRGRNSADGSLDASGREIYDIIDGINYVKTNFSSKVSVNRIIIVGFSGGGGNMYNAITKAPDLFAAAAAYFGITDYGESGTDSWRITNPSYSDSIIAAIGLVSEVDKYKARNTRVSALNYKHGWLYAFANTSDALVDHVNTEHIKTLFEASDYDNYEVDLSDVIYSHANYSAARLSDVLIKAKYSEAWSVDASGTLDVRGFVKTKRFEIKLGDMMNAVATVTYNTVTGSYTIAPVTSGNIAVEITQGALSYSGTINGNTTVIVS